MLQFMALPRIRFAAAAILTVVLLIPQNVAFGWGNKGHRMVNRLSWQHLPADMPDFLREPAIGDEVEYLGPEPDRWRSIGEKELSEAQAIL